MSHDNKDELFELLAHEKEISELYQKDQQGQLELPSAQLDSAIMAMAKQKMADNAHMLSGSQGLKQQTLANRNTQLTSYNAWKWPFSLVASVGFLGVLMITQRDYFIHPNDIVATDVGHLTQPGRDAPAVSVETMADDIATKQYLPSVQSEKMTHSAQESKLQLSKRFKSMETKRMSASQTPQVSEVQILPSAKFEEQDLKTSSMSLFELSKLAKLLTLELAIQGRSNLEGNTSIVKKQQTLFEHLAQHQKSYPEFKITKKFLTVLTDKQVQQLTLPGTEVVPDN